MFVSSLSLPGDNSEHLVGILSRKKQEGEEAAASGGNPLCKGLPGSAAIHLDEPETETHDDNEIVNIYGVLVCANTRNVSSI